MRLSALVTVAILFLSLALVSQHSTAGGGSSSSGGYSGGYSGGASSGSSHSGGSSSSGSYSGASSSHASSGGNSGGTRDSGSVSSSGGRTDRGRTGPSAVRSSNEHARFSNDRPEKKGFFSFFRHKKPEPKSVAFIPPIRCRRGQNCRICGGTRSGACIVETSCAAGSVWNGISCGPQYAWWSDCSDLANQLAGMRRQMQGRNDPGQSLMYRVLLSQYESCMERFGTVSFSLYPNLFDIP